MIVWRAMSLKEFMRFPNCWEGKVWFTTDEGYIASILARSMYRNRRVRDAYQVVVKADVRGYWSKPKRELGYLNIALDSSKPHDVRIISVWLASNWFDSFGKKKLNPMGYYWNKDGKLKYIVDKKELKNILVNGRPERGLFIRGDMVYKLESLISQ